MSYKTTRNNGLVPIYYYPPSQTIWAANSFITANRKLSALEEKLLVIIVGQIQPDDDPEVPYILTLKDLNQELKSTSHNTKDLVEALQMLQKTLICIRQNAKEVLSVSLLRKVVYNEYGIVKAFLEPEVKPYFINQKSEFTKFDKNTLLEIDSANTIRLYTLICQNAFQSSWVVPLTDLHFTLNSTESYKSNFHEFKRRVIEPAVTRLANLNIPLEYDEIKTGKKVTALHFMLMVELHNGVPVIRWEKAPAKLIPGVHPVQKEPTPMEVLEAFYPDWIKNWRETCHFTDFQINKLAQIDREQIKGTFYEIDQLLIRFKPAVRRTYFWKFYTDMFPELKPMTRRQR
jgi:Initiator Replication protein